MCRFGDPVSDSERATDFAVDVSADDLLVTYVQDWNGQSIYHSWHFDLRDAEYVAFLEPEEGSDHLLYPRYMVGSCITWTREWGGDTDVFKEEGIGRWVISVSTFEV